MQVTGSCTQNLKSQIDETLKIILDGYSPKHLKQDKIIRDALEGFIKLEKDEINLLDSPLLQRLRNIFQTSLSIYTYPSANHSRFEHSLGCLGMAQKVIDAIKSKHALLSPVSIKEIRLAALLHDVGHGPFSHASEEVYCSYPEIMGSKRENEELFKDSQPHEILTYFIITSNVFKEELWEKIVNKYTDDNSKAILPHVNLERIGEMVVGYTKNNQFRSQIINGPFDVDKLDYMRRDGYFSGVQTSLDYDRLLCTVGLHKDVVTQEDVLCTDLGGATVLEQVSFNKMLLFSAIYHHHKVRAASICFRNIFKIIQKENILIQGLNFNKASDFLKIDDYELFHTSHESKVLTDYIKKLKNRILLNRAFVLCTKSLEDKFSPAFFDMQLDHDLVNKCKNQILEELKKSETNATEFDVELDFPKPPSLEKITTSTIVKLTPEDVVTLEELYPTRGWATGYAQYRYRAYVFCKAGFENKVAEISKDVFDQAGLKTNKYAYKLAKSEIFKKSKIN